MERFWKRTLALKRFTGILDSYVSILSSKFSEITSSRHSQKSPFLHHHSMYVHLNQKWLALKDEFIEWSRYLGPFVSTSRSEALWLIIIGTKE